MLFIDRVCSWKINKKKSLHIFRFFTLMTQTLVQNKQIESKIGFRYEL